MKVNVKKVMLQFHLDYSIMPPSITAMAEATGMSRVILGKLCKNPNLNITVKSLERIVDFLYVHYKPNFPKRDPKVFLDLLVKSLVEYEIDLNIEEPASEDSNIQKPS